MGRPLALPQRRTSGKTHGDRAIKVRAQNARSCIGVTSKHIGAGMAETVAVARRHHDEIGSCCCNECFR